MSRFNILGFQYFTNDNEVLAGGKINFYQSGTTTRKDTFSDVEQTIPNTNPVVLTADGRSPDIFFTGSAKAVLTDADGVVIETLDPVGSVDTDSFAPWEPEKTYDQYAVVTGSDGLFYVSLINGNFANDPTISASEWKLLTEYIGFESSDDGYLWSVDNSEPQKVKAVAPLYTKILTVNAVNVATVDFTGLSADFRDYMVSFSSVIPVTDGALLQMRTSTNNGTSYDSGANNYEGFYGKLSGGNSYASTTFDATEITLTAAVGSDTNETGVNANVYVFRPSTAQYCQGIIDGGYADTGSNTARAIGAFSRKAAADVDAVRFFFSTGNIESGTITLYGVARA
jgi:hypothetical protein